MASSQPRGTRSNYQLRIIEVCIPLNVQISKEIEEMIHGDYNTESLPKK